MTLYVAESIRTIRTFTLEAALPGVMEEGCIYLRVSHGAERVRQLHDLLYAGVLRSFLRTDLDYVPHITIGSLADEKTARDACQSLKELSGPFTATIREVVIENVEADGRSVVEARLPLAE